MYTKQGICSNCNTTVTPLWRRGVDGCYLCNACGLYYKIHQKHRPTELKTDTFRQRNRFRRDFVSEAHNMKHFYADKMRYDQRMANINFYDSTYNINSKFPNGSESKTDSKNLYNYFSAHKNPKLPFFNKPINPKYDLERLVNINNNSIHDEDDTNEAIAIKVLLSLSKIHPTDIQE
jgi:GATA-binding protein